MDPATAKSWSKVLFSPRFAASRFQAPVTAMRMMRNPKLRAEAARQIVGLVGLGLTGLGLAALSGAEVGGDPEDSDFGKIVIGNTRIDIWGGVQQPVSLIARLLTGALAAKDLTDGQKRDLFDLVMRFSAYKMHPGITAAIELLGGKSVVGERRTPLQTGTSFFMPLIVEDVADAVSKYGPRGALVAPGVWFGLSISTFGEELRAGDIRPLLGKAQYKPPPPQWPDAIKDNPDVKEEFVAMYETLAAKHIRSEMTALKEMKKDSLRANLQRIGKKARAELRPYVYNYLRTQAGVEAPQMLPMPRVENPTIMQ